MWVQGTMYYMRLNIRRIRSMLQKATSRRCRLLPNNFEHLFILHSTNLVYQKLSSTLTVFELICVVCKSAFSWSSFRTLTEELRFYVPPDTKQSFQRHSFQSISWLRTVKRKQTQQKQTCIRNKIYYNIKLTHTKKLKPSLFDSHDLRPETERVYSGRSR